MLANKAAAQAMCAIGFRAVNAAGRNAYYLVHPDDELNEQERALYVEFPDGDQIGGGQLG